MHAVKHNIVHQYQPTPTTCSPTALSMLLGHYGVNMSAEEIEDIVPQVKDIDGNDSGTITQFLATWASTQDFRVTLYTFDCQIIDQSWSELNSSDTIKRLEAGLNGWVVPGIGEEWSKAYRQSYIDYLKSGSQLVIQPSVTSKLLYELLEDGPVFTGVCINTLYGRGRTKVNEPDDVNGRTWNHSIVIYGNDSSGNFLIADPIIEPGLLSVEPERMIGSIMAAQVECDNLVFQIQK